MDPEAFPREALRRRLPAAVGIERERGVWLTNHEAPSPKARQAIAALADSQHSPDQLEPMHADEWSSTTPRW